ncbi:hypothetical protein GYH30_028982 [Glycine max]|uniref:Uncharacterized protein n=1 Tax=Glycine max TaxID=3847 RepID=A0A0R0HYB2_SOYBN|nr:hypothetical protein GYH30_028982 [Glycine max]
METVSNSTTALYEYEWLIIQPTIESITILNEKELNMETKSCTEIANPQHILVDRLNYTNFKKQITPACMK